MRHQRGDLVECIANREDYPPFRSIWRVTAVREEGGTEYVQLEGLSNAYDGLAFRNLRQAHTSMPGWRQDWARYCRNKVF